MPFLLTYLARDFSIAGHSSYLSLQDRNSLAWSRYMGRPCSNYMLHFASASWTLASSASRSVGLWRLQR